MQQCEREGLNVCLQKIIKDLPTKYGQSPTSCAGLIGLPSIEK